MGATIKIRHRQSSHDRLFLAAFTGNPLFGAVERRPAPARPRGFLRRCVTRATTLWPLGRRSEGRS